MNVQIGRKPMSRGVTQLMYVGDVPDSSERELPPLPVAGILAAVAIVTKGATRTAATVAAAYFAYRGLRATHD